MKRVLLLVVFVLCLLNLAAAPRVINYHDYYGEPYHYHYGYVVYPVQTTYVVSTPRTYIINPSIAKLTTMASTGEITETDYRNRIQLARQILYTESVTGWVMFVTGITAAAISPATLLARDKAAGDKACLGLAFGGAALTAISLIPILDAESKRYDLKLSIKATGITLTF